MPDPTVGDVVRVLSMFESGTPVSLSYVTPSGQKRTARVKSVSLRVYDENDRPTAEIKFEPDVLTPNTRNGAHK